jgi:hypothetical protein
MPFTQGLRTRHARQALRHGEHFTGFFARREIQLSRHAERDTHPLARTRIFGCRRSGDRAPAPFELSEELEGTIAQALESGDLVH